MPAHPVLRTTGIAAMALALLAGACTSDDTSQANPSVDVDSDDLVLTAGLETFASCDGLLGRLQSEGLDRVGPYGFDTNNGFRVFGNGDDAAMEMAGEDGDATTETTFAAVDDAIAPGAVESDEGGTSTTNNQEVGVDQADLVKTDGERLVIVSESSLRVVDLADNSVVHVVDLGEERYGGELFLAGDRAFVMNQGWSEQGPIANDSDAIETSMFPVGAPFSVITEIDLVEGRVLRTMEIEGSYLSSRMIDGSVRVVVWSPMSELGFLYPAGPGSEERAEENNRAVIEDSVIDDWLPTYRLSEGSETLSEGTLIDCDRMFVPAEFAGFGSVSVITLDADAGLDLRDAVGVLSEGQTIYASPDRLAVATPRAPIFGEDGQPVQDDDYTTAIHNFDLTDPTRTDYVASGSVTGHLLNQYSLSEYDGNLRVATTAGDPWWGAQSTSESFITVLGESGDTLTELGKVGGIGEGEQIFAVRFMADIAYVVTFRQIDPLYAIDLGDPTNPTVLGELKIPGFSSYLHPLGDGMLLGVGQGGTEEGVIEGSQVSLFDVTDPTDPQLVDTAPLGDQAYSPVEWDARAFTFWNPTQTAYVPISWYRWDEGQGTEDNGTSVVAITVGDDATLTETGRITHPADEQCEDAFYVEGDQRIDFEGVAVPDGEAPPQYCYRHAPEIQRTVIDDGRIYTVSTGGVMISDLTTTDEIGWISFGG